MSLKRSLSLRGRAYLLLKSARRRANAKGIPYKINIDWLLPRLEQGCCEVTGIPFDLAPPERGQTVHPWSPSLHRENPEEGYTPNNTYVVCSAYNNARGQWGLEVFQNLINKYRERNGESLSETT